MPQTTTKSSREIELESQGWTFLTNRDLGDFLTSRSFTKIGSLPRRVVRRHYEKKFPQREILIDENAYNSLGMPLKNYVSVYFRPRNQKSMDNLSQ